MPQAGELSFVNKRFTEFNKILAQFSGFDPAMPARLRLISEVFVNFHE
jgi:hypothetical protein